MTERRLWQSAGFHSNRAPDCSAGWLAARIYRWVLMSASPKLHEYCAGCGGMSDQGKGNDRETGPPARLSARAENIRGATPTLHVSEPLACWRRWRAVGCTLGGDILP